MMKKLIEYFDKRLKEPEPAFKNKPNECIHANGKEYWISRAPAVVVVLLGIYKENTFVLAEQRSAIMDAPLKWAVPSGYLDWNESGWEAVVRELYEETSFYVPKYHNNLVFDNDQHPFFVNTNPTENRQNIAITYCLIYDFATGLPKIEKFKNKEIKQLKWISIDRVMNTEMYEWAFNHDVRIAMAVNKFEKYLQ